MSGPQSTVLTAALRVGAASRTRRPAQEAHLPCSGTLTAICWYQTTRQMKSGSSQMRVWCGAARRRSGPQPGRVEAVAQEDRCCSDRRGVRLLRVPHPAAPRAGQHAAIRPTPSPNHQPERARPEDQRGKAGHTRQLPHTSAPTDQDQLPSSVNAAGGFRLRLPKRYESSDAERLMVQVYDSKLSCFSAGVVSTPAIVGRNCDCTQRIGLTNKPRPCRPAHLVH